ncbi:EAL domain-containing protein [Shewanella gelidii]|uniref:cyclic-guanylate-specific phosphodiesterase n=1 Tax=Shewanella gelidii TaxID=1642821 RepID=A0A917JJD1_9GAMM|nr:EAL domain-containing protein [Shewanella gelidii]MCL1096914.1 EAL domain-containing protein [Shewanella gelidii]GGI71148.1 hypothetical protein GCM10009332_05550 [Shewanella gelidii]
MDSFLSLLNNAVLLVALGVIYDSIGLRNIGNTHLRNIASGLFIGMIGISVMSHPWELHPGVLFDTRWVLLSLSGLFFGLIPTAIAIVITSCFRLYEGGIGVPVGIIVIFASAATGLGWRYWLRHFHKEVNWLNLIAMGLVVEIVVTLTMLLLPTTEKYNIIQTITPILFTVFPIGTMLLGLLLKRQMDKKQLELELKKHERLLEKQKDTLQSIIDGIPDLIFYKSIEGIYLGCNKAFAEFMGRPVSEIQGKDDVELFGKENAKLFREKDRIIIAEDSFVTNEDTVAYPDGRLVDFSTVKTPYKDKHGKHRGIVGVSRNITDRKRVEQQLLVSEMTYRAVLSTALDGFFIISMQGKIIESNQSYCDMSGFGLNELIGLPINELDASTEHRFDQQTVRQVIQDGRMSITTLHRHKAGHNFPVEVNVRYWNEDGGKFFVFVKDISERIENQKKLIESEIKFKRIFDTTNSIAVQGYDKNRAVIYWNQASETLYGFSKEQAIGSQLEDLMIPEEHRQQVIQDVNNWVNGGNAIPAGELELLTASGDTVSVFSSHVMIYNSDNEPEMYCIDMDLTAQKQAEDQALTLSQALDQSPVSTVLTDTNGMIEYVNHHFEKVSGYSSQDVLGRHTRMLKSGKTSKSIYAELWSAITQGHAWEGELQNKKKNGEIFWEHAHIAPVVDSLGVTKHFLALKQDITQYKKQEEKILHQAHYDSLTELPNRLLSLDRLSQTLKDANRTRSKVAVLFLDLDDFKKVNDTLGHQVGDSLLIQAASRLSSCIRSNDVVGRLGGDEFIVILNNISDESDVITIAEKLLEQFSHPFKLKNRELVSTVSIGISVYPEDSTKPTELLRQADSAMYHSKELGRNTYNFFTMQMNQDMNRRLQVEEQLRSALQRQELEVYFQPLVDIRDRKTIGAEALLRWDNVKLGKVTPDEFIPIAEQTGLIVPIGRFVMEQAFTAAAQWQKNYQNNFRIAINVSPKQFRDSAFIEVLTQLLQEHQLASHCVELEITEGVLLSGDPVIAQTLSELNNIGVSISMDDFGTGYSSLSYLRSYPFDTVKVDKSFINDITVDPGDLELVGAAIAMGHGLNLNVIAEGVETEEQYQLLNALKCNYGQGYLFSRPVPLEEFEQILQREHQT